MKEKKKTRINYKRLIILILFVYALFSIASQIISTPIKNIYISNNTLLSDQEIIDIAKLTDHPSSLMNLSSKIKDRLEANTFINKAYVRKEWLSKVYIEVDENMPTFYNLLTKKTLLQDGKSISGNYSVGTLINYVPDNIYDVFIKKMALVNQNIILRISEIEYKPNEVDDSRFLLSMNDGNYVYLTLTKFDSVNEYINILKTLNHKKGILYLDSGEYFEILEG
jgi:cell division septal protein FtsQ